MIKRSCCKQLHLSIFAGSERGFGLTWLMVSLATMALLVPALGATFVILLGQPAEGSASLTVTRNLSQALEWVTADAGKAYTFIEGEGNVLGTFIQKDEEDSRSVTYMWEGSNGVGDLIRIEDGNRLRVATGIKRQELKFSFDEVAHLVSVNLATEEDAGLAKVRSTSTAHAKLRARELSLPVQSASVPVTVDFTPGTLNLNSGDWLLGHVELEVPEGFELTDSLNLRLTGPGGTIFLQILPQELGDQDNDGLPDTEVRLNRSEIEQIAGAEDEAMLNLHLSGFATGETNQELTLALFGGSDTFVVMDMPFVAGVTSAFFPFFNHAIFATNGNIVLSGNSQVTSSPEPGEGDIHANGNIKLTGNVTVEGQASATGEIDKTGNVEITGGEQPGSEPLEAPEVEDILQYLEDIGEGLPEDEIWEGDYRINGNGTHDIGPLHITGDLRISGNVTVVLNGPIYVDGEVKMAGDTDIQGPHVVVAENDIELTGNSKLSLDELPLILSKNGNIKVTGNNWTSAVLCAPGGQVTLSGNSKLYGCAVGASVKGKGNNEIEYPTELRNRE